VYSKKKTPDDAQRNYPKHVEFYSKNKFEKLVHLFGFVIRSRSSVNDFVQKSTQMFIKNRGASRSHRPAEPAREGQNSVSHERRMATGEASVCLVRISVPRAKFVLRED